MKYVIYKGDTKGQNAMQNPPWSKTEYDHCHGVFSHLSYLRAATSDYVVTVMMFTSLLHWEIQVTWLCKGSTLRWPD